jgi:hypothetical protein
MAQRTGRRGDAQGYIFPPLWGPDSFNDGAGMNRLLTSTRFIHQNMRSGLRLAYAISGSGYPVMRAPHWLTHLEADWRTPVWRR